MDLINLQIGHLWPEEGAKHEADGESLQRKLIENPPANWVINVVMRKLQSHKI